MVPVVADFGMARTMSDTATSGQTKTSFGPIAWMAPENLNLSYSEKSDIWSFGCLVYEVVTRKLPHHDHTDLAELAVAIKTKHLKPTIPPSCPTALRNLMKMCWCDSPDTRPSFDQLCKVVLVLV